MVFIHISYKHAYLIKSMETSFKNKPAIFFGCMEISYKNKTYYATVWIVNRSLSFCDSDF